MMSTQLQVMVFSGGADNFLIRLARDKAMAPSGRMIEAMFPTKDVNVIDIGPGYLGRTWVMRRMRFHVDSRRIDQDVT